MTSGLEVRICTEREWERAMLDGYAAWRLVRQHGHAALDCNLDARTITARPLTSRELADHAAVCESAIAQRAAKRSATT
jgi:hypothetical protein